jgi:hypothetical protein
MVTMPLGVRVIIIIIIIIISHVTDNKQAYLTAKILHITVATKA